MNNNRELFLDIFNYAAGTKYPDITPQSLVEFEDKHGPQELLGAMWEITCWMSRYHISDEPQLLLDPKYERDRYVKMFIEETQWIQEYLRVDGNVVSYRDEISEEIRQELQKIATEINSVNDEVYYEPPYA